MPADPAASLSAEPAGERRLQAGELEGARGLLTALRHRLAVRRAGHDLRGSICDQKAHNQSVARERRPIELMATLEKVNVPSFITDRAGTLTWLNNAALLAFGDLRGRPVSELVAPEHIPLVQRQLRRKLSGGIPVTDYTVDVLTADGRRRRAEISSVRIPNGDDAYAVFGIARPGPVVHGRPTVELTPRQDEVLQLLAKGASTDHIAATLHLSKETVRNHVRNILRALGAHSRLEAVAIAQRRGLLPREVRSPR